MSSSSLVEEPKAGSLIKTAAEIDPYELPEEEEPLVIEAQLLKIGSEEAFVRGGTLLVGLKRRLREIAAHYKVFKDPINALRGVILDMEKCDAAPLETAVGNLEPQLAKYDREQKAAAERERLRLQAIEDANARAAQQEAADAVRRVAAAEEHKPTAKALEREAKSIEAAPVASRSIAAPAVAKVPGLSISAGNYRAEIVDLMEVVKAVASGKLPLNVLEPERLGESHPFLDALAGRLGPSLAILCPAGLKVVEKDVVRGR